MSRADRTSLTDGERLALRADDDRHSFIRAMRAPSQVFLRTREDRLKTAHNWQLHASQMEQLFGQEGGLLLAAAAELEADNLAALGRRLRRVAQVEYELSLRAADALERGAIP